MTWSNLFSTESKYNLSISSSKRLGQVRLSLYLMTVMVIQLVLSLWLSNQPFWLLLSIALIVCLPSLGLFHWQLAKHTCHSNFVLSSKGEVQFSPWQHFSISPSSLILPFGCCLLLTNKTGHIHNRKKISTRICWLFDDQVSGADYRRLLRVIHYLQQS
ncbi:protein YgfX [Thalassotalea aquiviva]|uniref:protein YgfX n=1 Tax=Thalassotalea aquiviva TaxID=3242415 RepID=UPI00352A647D